ncbi:MAG: DMT family transporter [Papillibacter sp.]|jgi:drug/metabolite transporter (DMT)-like permease|nr:DMT family transporter [Papillibacter sp.]
MNKNSVIGTIILLLAAIIWGFAFVAQSIGMDYVSPFTFNGVRLLIGALVLLPLAIASKYKINKKTLLSGLICGLFVFAATNLQQIGLKYTTVGKAGFITTCYIIMVPIAGIFFKKKTGVFTWIAVVIAAVGLYLLSFKPNEGLLPSKGDITVFLCAVAFTGHIWSVDKLAAGINCVVLSCMQFLVSGVLSLIAAFIFESPAMGSILDAWLPILYAGVLSSGVAYTFQIIGQQRLKPTIASLLMSLESVFAVLGGWLILRQSLSARELIGCALMFAAIIIVQVVPVKKTVGQAI